MSQFKLGSIDITRIHLQGPNAIPNQNPARPSLLQFAAGPRQRSMWTPRWMLIIVTIEISSGFTHKVDNVRAHFYVAAAKPVRPMFPRQTPGDLQNLVVGLQARQHRENSDRDN
jgi:hypothetical protein